MASIVKKTVKGHAYYYLVESARVNGKPRIVRQQYLGTAENIAAAVSSKNALPQPEYSVVLQFGAVCALYGVAERLGIGEIIDRIAAKREQGLSVGDSIILCAINRAVSPGSKNVFSDWFDKTVLHNLFPAATKASLSSQGFWNNMSKLDGGKIRAIEDEITRKVVEKYDLPTECLLFDNTNFYTYIDTETPSELAKRGKCKSHRSDLKIIGLSMMVSPDHSIPLFHETYPGNTNDAKQFGAVAGRLRDRYRMLGKGECKLTLVFDKGNNSDDNIDAIMLGDGGFDVVGGLRYNQCPEFNSVGIEEFSALDGEKFAKTRAYRTTKNVYNREFTVVLTFNEELYDAQLDGVQANIAKCVKELGALAERLESRRKGVIAKGKKPSVGSVNKNVSAILSAEHMKALFECNVFEDEDSNAVLMQYRFSNDAFDKLKSEKLGRSILFTSHADWDTEKIVSVYRSQYHVEEAFRRMKDTKYLSYRPVHHFTDSNIRVHAFYCVLALMLASILNKEMEDMGCKMSIHKMLDEFSKIQQVLTYFPGNAKKRRCVASFSGMSGMAFEYIERYGIKKFALQV